VELADLRRRNVLPELLARSVARGGRVLELVAPEVGAEDGVVGERLLDHRLVYGPALRLVAVEERVAAPALEPRGQLSSPVDRVADAHVHAVAAEGRVQVARVAGQGICGRGDSGRRARSRPTRRCPEDLVGRSMPVVFAMPPRPAP
jgi:hypothetical protein